MTLLQIIELLREYTFLAIGITILFLLIFIFFYKVIYIRMLHRKKTIKLKKIIILMLFIMYIIIVICATFFSRNKGYTGKINLSLFNSYREAYFTGSESNWINIILNIMLFVPMGFFLPLLSNKLNKNYITISIGLLITLSIEILQTVTTLGIFEIDDIFNNVLGTLIGYDLINIIMISTNKSESKRILKILIYMIPLFITITSFMIIFTVYNMKVYGNLEIYNTINFNMKNIATENNIENLSISRKQANIYKTKILSRDEVIDLAKVIFERLGSEIDSNYSIEFDYFATVFCSTNGELLKINYEGGTYCLDYFDISSITHEIHGNNNIVVKNQLDMHSIIVDKDKILKEIKELGIDFSYDYMYYMNENYEHVFIVDMFEDGEITIDGSLIYFSDGDGNYSMENNLVKYHKVGEREIISESEAYKKLISGKFMSQIDYKNLKRIKVENIELDYMLDSKGFYQPVYKFDIVVNDEEKDNIYIQALDTNL